MAHLKQQLIAAYRRHLAGGRPVVPEAGVLLWNLFMEIGAGRAYHEAGPNPIGYAEIEAFCRLHRWPLQPQHIAIIRAMDDALLERIYAKMQRAVPGKDKPAFDSARYSAAPPLTAATFDLVFG